MTAAVLCVALASFFTGLFVVSRFGAWLAMLVRLFRPLAPGDRGVRPGLAAISLLLHSGPWLLAIAVAGIHYASTSQDKAYLLAALVGMGLAFSLVIATVFIGVWRRRHPKPAPQPLTPERLLEIRSSFFWTCSLFFGVATFIGLACIPSEAPVNDRLLFGLLASPVGFAGGWVWSWFMWQWYGEQLKVNEAARLKREARNVV